MSSLIPDIWKLIAFFEDEDSKSFTNLQKQGMNPRTLSRYLKIALHSHLLTKKERLYQITEVGRMYSDLIKVSINLADFVTHFTKIPREEIRTFLAIHVTHLRMYYLDRLQGVVLFGSSTTNKWRPESDIDLFIIVNHWNIPTWERATELYRVREQSLALMHEIFDIPVSYYPLDSTELSQHHAIYPDLQLDGIILWQRQTVISTLFEQIRESLEKDGKYHIKTPTGESLWITRKT